MAVMGPSGSGKTSLIHVLGGRRESGVSGSFVVNGKVYPNTRSLLGDLGYVTQEDVLLNSLTTKETLMFATRLRLAGRKVHGDETGMTKSRAKAIEEIVERAIHDFDLSRAANSPIGVVGQGGISGGEKRRLVIAMECVHRPKLLLLDEPTSGLDATTALLVCNKLRDIANGEQGSGHRAAVVTSIHQPRSSIMPLFDQCVLLADGREVYAGPTYEANPDGSLTTGGVMGWLADVGYRCPMFESPPDFLLDLINTRVDEPDVNAVEGDGVNPSDAVEGGGRGHSRQERDGAGADGVVGGVPTPARFTSPTGTPSNRCAPGPISTSRAKVTTNVARGTGRSPGWPGTTLCSVALFCSSSASRPGWRRRR